MANTGTFMTGLAFTAALFAGTHAGKPVGSAFGGTGPALLQTFYCHHERRQQVFYGASALRRQSLGLCGRSSREGVDVKS